MAAGGPATRAPGWRTAAPATARAGGYGEFAAGWPVVLSAMLGIGLGLSPLPFYTAGSFAPHLHAAFGWSFGQIFGGVTVTTVVVIACSPAVGVLSDRYGVRRVAMTSLVLFALAFMALGLSSGSLPQFYATWALVAAFGAGTLPITWTRAVNNRFEVRKGLALGLSLLGTGLFGYAVKPFAAWLIAGYGWRAAYVAIGALPLVIALPVAALMFHDVGPTRQTVGERREREAVRRDATPGLTARQAFADWRFWLIGGAFLPIAFTIGGVIPNLENILKLSGFAPATVVGLASLVGLSVVGGRAAAGWVLDRVWAPAVAVALLGLPAGACLILASGAPGYGAAATAVVLVGFAAGVEYDLLAFLTARYFGMKSYGLVYGGLYSFFSLGAGVGPMVVGAAYDRTHSYAGPLTTCGALLLLGAVMLLGLGPYRRFAQPSSADILGQAEATADTRSV